MSTQALISTFLNNSAGPSLQPQVALRVARDGGNCVRGEPIILVVEDEYPLQGIAEDTLIEGGFGVDVLSSAEEALALFRSGTKSYRALVTDVNLKGRLN